MSSSSSQKPEESRRPLDILFSIFSGVLIGLFLSKLNTPANEPTEGNSTTIHPENEAEPKTPLVPPPASANHYYPNRCQDNTPPWKKRTEIAAVCIAGLLLIANIFVTVGTWKAANAAKDAAEASEGQLRPWLDAEVTGIKVIFDTEGNASVEVTMKVVNVGHSPATDVNAIPNVINSNQISGTEIDETQRKSCKQFEEEPKGWGPAIFPGKDFVRTYGVPLSKVELSKTGKMIFPNIVGAVCYMTGKGLHRQTNFDYGAVTEILSDGRTVPIEPKNSRTIPADKITFTRIYEIGNGAN